ncbi:adaptin N terminal region-domain-containing protein [Protomyces lactucae-debilis]|uniref:AP complex subunit beta n=1 Tax=Protomyces lactucae-debilis TaxID=2754530 RepID=A0A1Y2FK74_PROLT|nr:adaptin N terminal region-domain-containing protein [Protomyces lactucae-debilis]ORY83626.1 adaptin N terminal region-domain-containing protein [Protomyces lactucae-debilis]
MSSSDSKFFQRGQVQELRAELSAASERKDKNYVRKRTVLKKIVANMTMNNDMSSLFPDVLRCMAISHLEIKKMCFLYLMNYARIKPEIATEALPYLRRDLNDENPLIRALALRTMSYIHVREINLATVDPLLMLMRDADPYVRKTAAICVAKLHAHDKRLVADDSPLLSQLRDMLGDANSTVIANALAALMDMCDRAENMRLNINAHLAAKLVAALNECSEWSQTYILEALMSYIPQTPGDAEVIAERVSPRLQHANASVVLTVIKLLLYLTNYMPDAEEVQLLCRKMSPPLITLLSKGPEVQFVALRNIELILQKAPTVLRNNVEVFFCKYNDPIYVKLAKLEILVKLAHIDNMSQVLAELQEYATEIDVDFVRKAVRSIGHLAVKVEASASKCIRVLMELVGSKISYVVQEVTVVIRDIFRKYPNEYESVISTLCDNLDSLDEPEAKAAMIWIIGEYAHRIEHADKILDDFLYTFADEAAEVQLALLTATVKLFIQRPTKGQQLVPKVLKWATEETDNPDLRDRGFMYWRLLSTDPTAAKKIIHGTRPPIELDSDSFDPRTLEELCLNLATLASIYHKTPMSFLRNAKTKKLHDSPVLQNKGRPSLQRRSTQEALHQHKAHGHIVPDTQVQDTIFMRDMPSIRVTDC